MNKIALIIGISGQDGSYLAKFLLKKGYEVWGTSRDAQGSNFNNLKLLGIYDQIKLISMPPEDFRSVLVELRKCNPDEVYNLAGQSSVSLSFDQPVETVQSIVIGSLNLLEACRMLKKTPRVYYAGSSESFGNTNGVAASEKTLFHPQSPYGVAKASAFWIVDNYRNAYKLFACTGILFNHESLLRPERFVTKKIISTATRIANGSKEILELGRLDISRDWGWAPEYVEAMWLMLQQDKPDDYVIATGEQYSVREFCEKVADFHNIELIWQGEGINEVGINKLSKKEIIKVNPKYFRPTEVETLLGDASKARKEMGWNPKISFEELVQDMCKNGD